MKGGENHSPSKENSSLAAATGETKTLSVSLPVSSEGFRSVSDVSESVSRTIVATYFSEVTGVHEPVYDNGEVQLIDKKWAGLKFVFRDGVCTMFQGGEEHVLSDGKMLNVTQRFSVRRKSKTGSFTLLIVG